MLAGSRFVLRVPVDASQVPDFNPHRGAQILVWGKQSCAHQYLRFDGKGHATAKFGFDGEPESVQVALGPESASPVELRHLRTASVAVPSSAWLTSGEVELPPIRVSSWDWWWWQHWRQSFRVTGHVVNDHGRPVVGATVSAFDVDVWWWWTSQEQVGTAVTGIDGSFTIDFTRCCGWWPWWWWITRDWQVDTTLVEWITRFVRQYPGLDLLAAASPVPTLDVFQPLLNATSRPIPPALAAALSQSGRTIDPAALASIRERLMEILPRKFPLPVWPWSEWSPWEDCGASLLFRVTEKHHEQTAILVNESVQDVRWDIPASTYVQLIAREATLNPRNPDWTLVDYLFPEHRRTADASSQLAD